PGVASTGPTISRTGSTATTTATATSAAVEAEAPAAPGEPAARAVPVEPAVKVDPAARAAPVAWAVRPVRFARRSVRAPSGRRWIRKAKPAAAAPPPAEALRASRSSPWPSGYGGAESVASPFRKGANGNRPVRLDGPS